MKSYKCFQCGLTNWAVDELCKRCHNPNPYLNQSVQSNAFPSANIQNSALGRAHQKSTVPEFSSPPPPNTYGAKTGNTSHNHVGNSSVSDKNQYQPFQKTLPIETIEKLRKAEKDINNAWLAGQIWGVFVGLISLVFFGVLVVIAGKEIDTAGFIIMLLIILLGGIIYSLSYGVKQKSRVCVIILLSLTSIALLNNLFSLFSGEIKNGLSFAFSIILTYYFAVGTQGTFTYHKIRQQHPNLIK